MTKQTTPAVTVTDPDAREKLHIARVLLGGYAAVSVLTLLAIVVFSGNPGIVTDAVWIRGSILAVASLITFDTPGRASDGRASRSRPHRRTADRIAALPPPDRRRTDRHTARSRRGGARRQGQAQLDVDVESELDRLVRRLERAE
ncbi:hypothetical protein [Amycolatopsis thermoflava]|uniref:hypothetical protein n=1 Tax=Amycolatopsis thermoflava TaxID=84480 RepID=UPI00041407AA|nr:hypothetical protein [Amycolatopsis thermoflava]